jgi:hypothetical protein
MIQVELHLEVGHWSGGPISVNRYQTELLEALRAATPSGVVECYNRVVLPLPGAVAITTANVDVYSTVHGRESGRTRLWAEVTCIGESAHFGSPDATQLGRHLADAFSAVATEHLNRRTGDWAAVALTPGAQFGVILKFPPGVVVGSAMGDLN